MSHINSFKNVFKITKMFKLFVRNLSSYRYVLRDFDQVKLTDVIMNMYDGSHYRIYAKSAEYRLYDIKNMRTLKSKSEQNHTEILEEHMKGQLVDPINIPVYNNSQGGITTSIERSNAHIFNKGIIRLGRQYLLVDPIQKDKYYWSNKLNASDITIDDDFNQYTVLSRIDMCIKVFGYSGEPDAHCISDDSYYELQNIKDKSLKKLYDGDNELFIRALVQKYPIFVSE